MARLPTPGGDNNQWGDVLNTFLAVEHASDGTQKPLPQSKITGLSGDLAAKVDAALTITGTSSITGGGDLSANRSLALVNDSASPGVSKYYGTDGSGAKGYFGLPSGGAGSGDSNEALSTVAAAGSTPIVNVSTTGVHDLTLTANATLTITGAAAGRAYSLLLVLRQDATGNRIVTWPGSVKWPSGSAPTLSTGPNAVDMLSFITVDGGANWLGTFAEANFQ